MKTKLLLALCLIQAWAFAQVLPNAGFENWTTVTYSNPTPWYNSNLDCIQSFSVANVTRVTGFSGFAVRLQTYCNATDSNMAYINHSWGDPTFDGGVPYTQQPTGITGYFRYNLPVNDTALLLVTFKKNGLPISTDLFKIRGTGTQATFTPFNYTLSLAAMPDSVIIAAASSNAFNTIPVQNGSYLELDQLAFTGPGITQAIPGGDFETWTPATQDFATSWNAYGPISKSTSSFAGTYAALLSTMNVGYLAVGYLTNGIQTPSTTAGGTPYSTLLDTLVFHYKYTSPGTDTAQVFVGLKKNGSYVFGNSTNLYLNPSYTLVKVPLNPFTTPDTIIISFNSSKWMTAIGGSNLWIDNMGYKSSMTGISQQALINNEIAAYPNPTSGNINIRFNAGFIAQAVEISVYDVNGRKVLSEDRSNPAQTITLETAHLNPGIYFYEIKGTDLHHKAKFIKQ
jgi:hypothetical protein